MASRSSLDNQHCSSDEVLQTVKTDMVKHDVEVESLGKSVDEIDKPTKLTGEMQLKQEDRSYVHASNELHLHVFRVVAGLDDGVAASFQRSRIHKPHAYTHAFKVNRSTSRSLILNFPTIKEPQTQVDQGSQIKMIQVKEMMQDNDLKNSKSKDKGSRSRSQSMNEQSHYKQDKTKTRQSINVKSHIFNIRGDNDKSKQTPTRMSSVIVDNGVKNESRKDDADESNQKETTVSRMRVRKMMHMKVTRRRLRLRRS
ncbi:hypothetical protein Tco_0216120 [Tanacetum coccineum]